MPDSWLYPIGVLAVLHGTNSLEQARKGRSLRPLAIVGAFFAGYLLFTDDGWLRTQQGALHVVGWTLLFAACAPVVGYVLYSEDGCARFVLRAIALVVLAAVSAVLWSFRLTPRQALIAGACTAVLPFLPWRTVGRWWADARHRRHRRRQQKREAKLQAQQRRQESKSRAELRELHRLARRSLRAVQSQERRLAIVERGEHRERARLHALREEVRGQVQVIRREEVRRIKAGDHTLQLHPHFGFLMLEAWRVLRAELTTRINGTVGNAASEHDAYFFQVVAELTDPPDFEQRYLHEVPGQRAVAVLSRYFQGHVSLERLHSELVALPWAPHVIAPLPVRGINGLLEAWLLPHRRQQDLAWQLFCAGDHPDQEHLNGVFDDLEITLPTREQWFHLHDEQPQLFRTS